MDDFSWFITDFEEYLDEERNHVRNELSNSQVEIFDNVTRKENPQEEISLLTLQDFSLHNSNQNNSSSTNEVPIKHPDSKPNKKYNPLKLMVPTEECQQGISPLLNTRPVEVPKDLLSPEETKMVVATGMSSGGLVRVQRGWSEESGYRSASLGDPTSPSGDSEVSITELMSSSNLGRTCDQKLLTDNNEEDDSENDNTQDEEEEDELVLVPSGKYLSLYLLLLTTMCHCSSETDLYFSSLYAF